VVTLATGVQVVQAAATEILQPMAQVVEIMEIAQQTAAAQAMLVLAEMALAALAAAAAMEETAAMAQAHSLFHCLMESSQP
jgi:hypothetical protein